MIGEKGGRKRVLRSGNEGKVVEERGLGLKASPIRRSGCWQWELSKS